MNANLKITCQSLKMPRRYPHEKVGFLVDLFVILLELAICAFIVFYLISHPIVERVTVNNVATTRSLDSSNLSHSSNVLARFKAFDHSATGKGSAGYSSGHLDSGTACPGKTVGLRPGVFLYHLERVPDFGISLAHNRRYLLIFRDIFLTRTQCYAFKYKGFT